MISGLHTVVLQVSDLERALGFYEGRLGIRFRRVSDRAAQTEFDGAQLMLHVDHDPTLAGKDRAAGMHLNFAVGDVDGLYAKLRGMGSDSLEPPANRPWGRQFGVTDPDGYTVEFVGPSRRS